MTGSTQHGPGQETLEEEEAKRQFFAELEENNSSLNYSELNRQLGSTATSLLARFVGHLLTSMHSTAFEAVSSLRT